MIARIGHLTFLNNSPVSTWWIFFQPHCLSFNSSLFLFLFLLCANYSFLWDHWPRAAVSGALLPEAVCYQVGQFTGWRSKQETILSTSSKIFSSCWRYWRRPYLAASTHLAQLCPSTNQALPLFSFWLLAVSKNAWMVDKSQWSILHDIKSTIQSLNFLCSSWAARRGYGSSTVPCFLSQRSTDW